MILIRSLKVETDRLELKAENGNTLAISRRATKGKGALEEVQNAITTAQDKNLHAEDRFEATGARILAITARPAEQPRQTIFTALISSHIDEMSLLRWVTEFNRIFARF